MCFMIRYGEFQKQFLLDFIDDAFEVLFQEVWQLSIFVVYFDEFKVILFFFLGKVGQMWVFFFIVLVYYKVVVVGIFFQEVFGVVVVNVDFGECIVSGRFFIVFMVSGFQLEKQQFQFLREGSVLLLVLELTFSFWILKVVFRNKIIFYFINFTLFQGLRQI